MHIGYNLHSMYGYLEILLLVFYKKQSWEIICSVVAFVISHHSCAFLKHLTEAVDAIITYSHTAGQLLRRKKVKREHIYQYLAENGVVEPGSSDKPTLIRRLLLYWGSSQEVHCRLNLTLQPWRQGSSVKTVPSNL